MAALLPVSMGTLAFLAAVMLAWLSTPWPTEAARYAWEKWRMPRTAILLNREDAALAMQIGTAYYGRANVIAHDPELARRAFEQAVRIDPRIPFGHYALSRIAFTEGKFLEALEHISAEIDAHPENLRSLYIRGLIYGFRAQGADLQLAEHDFARFIEWAPTEWAGYNDLAWILAKQGKYEEMEHVMHEALESVPPDGGYAWLYNSLGVARLNLGKKEGAAEAFEKALAYAEQMTQTDWRRAYAGNDPAGDQGGLDAFLAGIKANLEKTRM